MIKDNLIKYLFMIILIPKQKLKRQKKIQKNKLLFLKRIFKEILNLILLKLSKLLHILKVSILTIYIIKEINKNDKHFFKQLQIVIQLEK